MFRRARLSVKPNVRPGVGARGSTASNPQRGRESPRPPDPATDSASKPAEPTDVPTVDFGGAEPQEKAPRSSTEKTGGDNDVEESSRSSSTVSQRRKRISSTSSLVKSSVSVPSESHPLSTINQEAPQPTATSTKEKQPCSDRYRIYKAQKLREMLKEELRKEKKQWKNKYAINESQRPPDRSKMTMRDFIYYLPDNNPMTSSLEQEKKTEKPSTPVQTREQEGKSTPNAEDNEMEEETDDGPLLVPRVKVAEDGSIILDEESLTVEVLRTKGPCVVEENDPIFERGSTTTYSSFRKNYYSKPWSNKETDMFFLAISMVGTDFSMIGQLFPHRARIEIKNKFKREEKTNGWRIDKAFQEKRPFDFDFFAHLLQKVLAEEEKRKQKSVKNHSLKEKKSTKPRKNVKVKKVACEGVNNDPDESMSSRISDTERSQKDAQTVEEESLTLSREDAEQVALEVDLNQKKRRRKKQDGANELGVNNLLENATVQAGPSKGEKHKNKCQAIRPELKEGECSKEQMLSCTQNIDGIVGFASTEKVEKRTDPILSLSNQQDATSVATESSESSTSDLPSFEVGIRALCEVNNAEGSCIEERNVDLKNNSLEIDQTENVKPMLRGRFQRPKPNLSRAGKKSVLSQGKTESESKNSHSKTSVEKNHVEKDKMNTLDILRMETTERENPEAETVSVLGEKNCLQEGSQLKALRPVQVRGRLQKPKPNAGKAAERKEILISQEEIGANVEKNENESCADRDTPQHMEDQSRKDFEEEDVILQPEKNDSFQNVQPDEPKVLNECLSVQENNKANKLNQVPILRTRFQKPKPNIGRGTGRREISSKEEVLEKILVSGEMAAALRETVRLDTSPKEMVPAEINTKEMQSDLKETGRRAISPREKILDVIDDTIEMETGLKAMGREICLREKTPEVIDATEEIDKDLEEAGRREISPQKNGPEEVKPLGEVETDLKATGNESSPREKTPEVTDATEEIDKNLEETGRRKISPRENGPEEVKPVDEMETDLNATGRESSPREKTPEVIDATEEIDLEETEREVSPQENGLEEVKPLGEMETDLKATGRDSFPRGKTPEVIDAIEEIEIDLEETEREISPQENGLEEVKPLGEMQTDLKATGREISPREKTPEVIDATEEIDKDLEETGRREISPEENGPEEVKPVDEMETDLKTTGREGSSREKTREVIDAAEVIETDLEETEREISPQENGPEEVKPVGKMETDLKEIREEISQREKVLAEFSAIREKEIDLKETGKRDIPIMEKVSGKMAVVEEMEADLKETGKENFRERGSEEICVTEEKVAELKQTGKTDISPRENELEETSTSRQTDTHLMQSGSNDFSAVPSLDIQNISSEVLSMMHTPVEEKRNSEKEVSSHFSHFKISSQTHESDKTEVQGIQSPDVPEQFSDINLSKSLPQEQKPLEIKPAPFVRSRFKRPKPNLARAALKRETTESEKYIYEKKSETKKMETIVMQENNEQTDTLPSQHDEASLMISREKDTLGHRNEEAVILPCTQTERNLSPSNSCEPKEESQSAPVQKNDSVVSVGTNNVNTFQQEMKESVIQTARQVRGRLQRPRPNIRKTGQRQIVDKGEAKGIIKEGRTILPKDETEKKVLTVSNSQIETEIEVPSSAVPEHRMYENQSQVVLVENLHVNKTNETIRHENKPYVPSSAQMTRRKFQKAKPNLGRAHSKKEEPVLEKVTTDQSKEGKPEDHLLQKGASNTQLLLKEKAELLTSLEVSARKDCVGSKESALAKIDAELEEVGPSRRVGEETVGDNSPSSVVEEQYLNKLTSCPQPLNETSYSKIALDGKTTISSTSEYERNRGERRSHKKFKPNVTRGRGSKRVRGKTSKKEPRASKAMLVTLRASQEEDDDADDFESDYEEESYHLAPEEVNKAPVFVPVGLRSPEPVSAQIEETMEELEITVNVPDVGCIAVVEHELPNTDVTTEEMKQEENLSVPFEMTTSEHIQDEPGTNDGSTEAAITLLTMGDLVLQSEISSEQGDVGVCIIPHVHSKDKSHIPSSLDNVNHKIVHECQELSSPVITTSPASFEENKIVLEEQSSREEISLMEKVKENATPTRNTISKVTSNLRIRSRLAKPKPNLEKTLGTNRLDDYQEVSSLCVTKGAEMETQRVYTNKYSRSPTREYNQSSRPNSICLPATSVGQDAMGLSISGRDNSKKPPDNLDLVSRKRFQCRLDKNDHIPPAKKRSLTLRDDCQEYTTEVHSKELTNVFEETGESHKGQDIFLTSGSTLTTPEPQRQQVEAAFQSRGSRSPDACMDKNVPQLPQDEMIVSDKEERTDAAPKSQQMDSRTSSSKASLSRPGRRPLGFLSLICSKNSLESDEPMQVHSKKRLKPLIPGLRKKLKRSNPFNESQEKNRESSDLLPSPSVITTQSENISSSATQVSCDQPLLKEGYKSAQKRAPQGEATTVSEYFFNDIFIEVDETE
ncbi:transcription factor TFIIIB component B'' homolog isoform X4 [Homo sapiens]|uniref:transcription factor TFIIIB component B'' homolog isoform X4 n=1 Tax=Homo sapiens TaxID=9606 RepID=UPI0005D02F71|nr:transcription factor TFIIIB component B'' homolog isoform X4 [Homo sapiens]XP_054185502.1 transcription factor TFIIIB component B'' homolog isoform X4 [Homo sapiens]|eukprot:XP_011541814.1 transcription factor TFIIIB component B'' homolog isoform X4 [Homo sapiens]